MSDVAAAPADAGSEVVPEGVQEASTETPVQAEGTPAPTEQEPKAEAKAPAKAEPKEEPPEAKKASELTKAAYKRFEEAAAMRKQADSMIAQVKGLFENPEKLFEIEGFKERMREASIKYFQNEMQMEQLSPEQRKLKEYEGRLQQIEAERQKQIQAQEEVQLQQQQEHYRNLHAKKITEALNEVGLKDSPAAVRRMAGMLRKAAEEGYEVDHKDLAGFVREELQNEHRDLYSKMDGSAIAEVLGKENVDKLLKWSLTQPKKTPVTVNNAGQLASAPKPLNKMSPQEYRDYLEKMSQHAGMME